MQFEGGRGVGLGFPTMVVGEDFSENVGREGGQDSAV